MPDPDFYRKCARDYVDQSSAHELATVFAMFAADAVYRSGNVGEHRGRSAIEDMMRDFFGRFPGLRWQVEAYESVGEREVGFAFTRIWTNPETGEACEKTGYERLRFNEAGLIEAVEVS